MKKKNYFSEEENKYVFPSDTFHSSFNDKILLDGLVNIHLHLGETIYSNLLLKQLTLDEYILKTNEINSRIHHINRIREIISYKTLVEAITYGTSHVAGPRYENIPSKFGITYTDSHIIMNSAKLKNQKNKLIERIRIEDIPSSIFIHSLNYTSHTELVWFSKIIKEYPQIRIMIHVAETESSESEIIKLYGKSSIEVLNSYGLLNERTLLIHCNEVSDEDIKIIKRHKSWIVHCPSTSIWMNNTLLPLSKIYKDYKRVCIATDGVATGGTISLLSEARTAYLYHNRGRDKISARDIFRMITLNPATALDLIPKTHFTVLDRSPNLIHEDGFYHQLIFFEENHRFFAVISNKKIIYKKNNPNLRMHSAERQYQKLLNLVRDEL